MNYMYLRVSGASQTSGDGYARQELAIKTYAVGVNFTSIVQEQVSGTKDDYFRPLWVKLVSDAKPGSSIYVEKLDRLSRDLGLQEYLIRDLKKRELNLISAAEPDLCSSDPTRVLIRHILGAVAHYERSLIVHRTRVARERVKAEKGKCEGRKFYGETDDREKATVEMIKSMRDQGFGLKAICKYINEQNILARSGGKWHITGIARVLGRERANGTER